MDMGYADYGGGPRPSGHGTCRRTWTAWAPAGGQRALAGHPDGRPIRTWSSTSPPAQGEGEARLGQDRRGLHASTAPRPGRRSRQTVGQLVEVRVHNEDVAGRDRPALARRRRAERRGRRRRASPRTRSGPARTTPTAGSRRTPAPSGTTPTRCPTSRSPGGCSGAIVIHPRRRSPGCVETVAAGPPLRRRRRPLNGRTGDHAVRAEPGQRVRVRTINTDNGPLTVLGRRVPSGSSRSTGTTSTGPTEVTDRSVVVPAGGRADLEVHGADRREGRRRAALGDGRLVIGPAGSTRPGSSNPRSASTCSATAAHARCPFDTHQARPAASSYSIGRRPGFIDGRPGLWWSVDGHLYPDMPMFVVREGDVVQVTDLQPQRRGAPDAPARPPRGRALPDGKPVTRQPVVVRLPRRRRTARPSRSPSVADNPGIWMDHCHNLKHAAQGHGHPPDVRRRDHAVPGWARTPATSRSDPPDPVTDTLW